MTVLTAPLACAALLSAVAASACAATIDSATEFSLQTSLDVDVIGEDGPPTPVAPETALRLVSGGPFDPRVDDFFLAGPEVSQVGPGFASARASRGGTAMNLLDEEIEALLLFTAGVSASIALEGPGEVGRAVGAVSIDVAGAEVAAFEVDLRLGPGDPACPAPPSCSLENSVFNDGDNPFEEFGFRLRLAPGETVPFRITTSSLAVAPIPLPPAAPAAVVLLGAMA